jgi:hypothetical protein
LNKDASNVININTALVLGGIGRQEDTKRDKEH